ncbi:hypothetical protein RGAI101_640 [Roseobacter sp. GAI101]|nr:hypothetical protein RGAI101_640 [Roseobacter sp. GAI101]
MGQPFPRVPELDLHSDADFWALAELEGGGFAIRVGGGVVPMLERLWGDAFSDEDFTEGVSLPLVADKVDAIHVSLVWLIFHEMQHFELGHFDLIGSSIISETERGKAFSLASRGSISSERVKNFGDAPQFLIEQCLELQADHDGAELVLDAYSTDEWPSLRARIAAISAMMMLIEREDAKLVEQAQSSHPKAATRIFQLLGHVMEMPLIPAQRKAILNGADAIDPADLPSDAEQSAFNREVVIPAFFDAVNLARVAGAQSIRQDLGEAGAFFQDVQIAKIGDVDAFESLQTVGAKQWAELVVINEQLKADHS